MKKRRHELKRIVDLFTRHGDWNSNFWKKHACHTSHLPVSSIPLATGKSSVHQNGRDKSTILQDKCRFVMLFSKISTYSRWWVSWRGTSTLNQICSSPICSAANIVRDRPIQCWLYFKTGFVKKG